ncbi:MAG: hypothetical protein WBV73_27770 [Phormidium sp.]
MTVNLFDPNYYRVFNPDLGAAGVVSDAQLVEHFVNIGVNEGRLFSPFVNLDLYRAVNPDLGVAGITSNSQAFYHLQSYGIAEGRRFSMGFNAPFYQAVNPDLAAAGINNNEIAFEHFRAYGVNEGRLSAENFNVQYYLGVNADLQGAGLNFGQAFTHYVTTGYREGRPAVPGGSRPSFISTSSGQIGTIDITNGQFQQIGVGPAFTDIALSNNGQIFGITFNNLYRIDPLTGASSAIGSPGTSGFNALAFSADNRLYTAVSGSSNLYTIDPLTGSASFFANLGSNFSSAGDLVFDPINNRLFATSKGSGSDVLFSIGLNGVATRIGNIGFSDVFGLDLKNGTLLGYTANKQQIMINQATGAGTFMQNVTGVIGEIFGAT